MFLCHIGIFLLFCVANAQSIVGGTVSASGQFPYQVSLRSASNVHFCGGNLINNRWVLSSAHCTIGRTTVNTRVVVGDPPYDPDNEYEVSSIQRHPFYFNGLLQQYDVGLVKTAQPITFSNDVQPIALTSQVASAGQECILSGWGLLGSDPANIEYIETTVLDLAECAVSWPWVLAGSAICTPTFNYTGLSPTDSGNGLTISTPTGSKLIAVVSVTDATSPYVYITVSSVAVRLWLKVVANVDVE